MIEIYTSYISKTKDIGSDILKVFVCRFLPNSINLEGCIYSLKLAPSKMLLSQIKNNEISFDEFKGAYVKELDSKKLDFSNINTDKICFICYEKNPNECHRSILAKYLVNKGNFIYKGEI